MVHENHLMMVQKLRRKPQKNTVNGTLDLRSLRNTQFSNFSVTFKRQGEKRLE
jgi:hypothetical protein